jgi:DNA-binding PadR family transcriptional regulator
MNITKIMEKNLKAFLDIVILAILREGFRHGYKIIATFTKNSEFCSAPVASILSYIAWRKKN